MSIIILIVGLIFSVVGVFLVIDHKNFLKKSRKTNGNVVAIEKYKSTNSDNQTTTYYRSIVDFTANSDDYRLTSSIGSGGITHEVGQRISILYMPDNPKDARLNSPVQYILGIIFAIVGICASSVYVFMQINYGFAWWDGLIAIFICVLLFVKVRKLMKLLDVKSIDDIKNKIKKVKKEQGNAVIIGSDDDPLLDNTRIFYRSRKGLMKEKGRLDVVAFIINILFLAAGLVMLYFGWDIYQEEVKSPSPDMVRQYALLGMGALFTLSSLLNLLKSGRNVNRV